MATMTHRATFALDDGTTASIKSLAKLWKVSQAEVVRRAVSQAEVSTLKPDPVALLQQLHAAGEGLPAKTANTYLAEVREDRKKWRGQ
ncbi:MAG TPA: hypothetical protein VGE39_09975 [Prosthecobacter sp.]